MQDREIFHRELKAFMKDLIKVFPDDREIKLVSSSMNIAMMDDPEDDVIKKFYASFSPCEKLIQERDETLFNGQVINSDVELFSKIGDYWAKLDVFNKEVVWKYTTLLYMLSKKILTA